MLVLRVETEFGLNSGAVDAESVETLASPPCELHILLTAVSVDGEGHLQVHAGDDLGVGELPDVDVVAADDTGEGFNIFADIGDTDVLGGGLEEYPRGCAGKRNRRLENDGGDEEGNGRIGVVLARPVGEPDDQGRDDDTEVSKGIANDVKNHGVHAHVAVAVTVTALLAWLAGKRVVVTIVHAGVPTTASLARRQGTLSATGAALIHGTVITLGILEQRRLLTRTLVVLSRWAVLIGVALAVWLSTGGRGSRVADDVLAEAGRVNAHILDAGQARVVLARLARSAHISAARGHGCLAGPSVGVVPTRLIVEPYATMLVIRAGALASTGCAADDNLWRSVGIFDGGNVAGFVGGPSKQTLLFIVAVAMFMIAVEAVAVLVYMVVLVLMIVIMVMTLSTV